MTDAELRDEALVHLKKTTVGYVNKHWKVPPPGSEWDQALDLLVQIGQAPTPDPIPPIPVPKPNALLLNGLGDLNAVFRPVWTQPAQFGAVPNMDGGGLFEADTPYGKGFKFVSTDKMAATWDAQNNTRTKVCLAQGSDPSVKPGAESFWGALGKTEKWRFCLFMPKQTLPNLTTWHAGEIWQWHTSSASGHHISLDPNQGGRFRIGRLSGKTSYDFVYTPIIFDRWVEVEWDIRWSTAIDGFSKLTFDGRVLVDFRGPTDFNDGARRHQFGWYADRQYSNTISFGGISVERS